MNRLIPRTALACLSITALALAACASTPPTAPSAASSATSPSRSVQAPATAQADERQAVLNLMQRYQQAMRNANLPGIAATLHDDVVTTFADRLTARGKAAVLQNYQATFAAIDFAGIEYLIDDVAVSHDLAVVSTYHPVGAFVTHKSDQKKIPDHNRELFVLKKVQDQWLIQRYMFNQTPEQAR
ncbi:MAG: nuclear transport factor 2 family protein [Pseudomonadota bacterium]|nr:nuclear transport factor 2 family protein [Pseudomonadota bacterium]